MAKTSANPFVSKSPVTLKERLAAFKNIPAFFKLVWQASPVMTFVSVLLRLVRAAMPLLLLYVGKLIIDEVVRLSSGQAPTDQVYLWELVGLEFTLAIASDALGRAISLLDGLLGDRFANMTSIKIMEHAATLDLDQFEDAVFYDKLERARQQTLGRTILLSQVMGQVQDLITVAFLAAGLLVFNPWLILLLLLAILPAIWGESYFNDRTYALTRSQTPQRRELDYLRYLGASDETAKEIKIFDLSGFIINRFKVLSTKFYEDNRRIAVQRSLWGTFFALLGSASYYGAYVYLIAHTTGGNMSIGELIFLAGSFRQLRTLLEGILTRLTAISQGAIYLRDFFDFFEIESKLNNAAKARPFPNPIQQGFTFENVGFRYLNSERWANRHLNFTLHPGENWRLWAKTARAKPLW